jgi:integrase
MGLAVITMFIAYLRPSECLSLRNFQLVRRDPRRKDRRNFFTFVLAPEEIGEPTKTNLVDVNVPIDLPEHEWIADIWDRVAERGALRPTEHVFKFQYRHLLEQFRTTMDIIGCDELGATPHCLRHGGASEDYASRARSLNQIQKRGQWKSAASVQRYSKPGRIGLQLQKLENEALQLVECLSHNAERFFRGYFDKLYDEDDLATAESFSRSSRAAAP